MVSRERIRAAIAEVWVERVGVEASMDEHIDAMVDRVIAITDEFFPEDCSCGWGGTHDRDNPRCDANIRRMMSP